MSESSETRELCRLMAAKPLLAMTYPLIGSERAPPGWPDRYMAWAARPELGLLGWRGFVEFKSATGSIGKKQLRIMRGLQERGERVIIARIRSTRYEFYDPREETVCLRAAPKTALAFMRACEAS